MEENVVYSYGKEYCRKNVLKEMMPVLFISILFSSLVYGICKLELKYGILLFVILFIVLSYSILPGAFESYWSIDKEGVTFANVTKQERRKLVFKALTNQNMKAEIRLSKHDINLIKIVYKKNILIGPAKRTPDTFYILFYAGKKKKKIDLTNVSEDKASNIIKILPTLCKNIEDELNIVDATIKGFNLYDFIYSIDTANEVNKKEDNYL